jgi:predicted MFS family arabinose efflux permease
MLSRRTVRLFSLCGGIVVANLYYNQPLLSLIASSFHVEAAQAGVIPALTQGGYALGLFLLVPLADYLNPRKLVAIIVAIVTLALLVAAAAPRIEILQAASFVIGVFSVVPQILLPLAASMAEATQRGRTIGSVMAGLLTGVLLSRTLAGFVGRYFGWRTMYAAGAALMLFALALVFFAIPDRAPTETFRYRDLLRSLGTLTRSEPVLREVSFIGAMCFGAFSCFWSTLAFLLAAPPYHMSSDVAGLFGVVGIVGVTAAPLVGRRADRESPRRTAAIGIVVMIVAFIIFAAGARLFAALVVGVILIDFGVQTALVSNQARMYAINAEAAGRLNTVFMTSYFLGGALGSALASLAWTHSGWVGVCAVAVNMLIFALVPYVRTLFGRARTAE